MTYFNSIYCKIGIKIWMLPLMAITFFCSCSNTKYLSKSQTLLVGSNVNLKGDLTSSEKEEIKSSLTSPSVMIQHPNTKLLNLLRMKLWLYNQKNNEKKTGKLWNWLLIDKNLEAPVLYDSSKTRQSAANMVNYLNNQGFFYASVSYNQKVKNQKASLTYQVNTGDNFIIDSIEYNVPDSTILQAVRRSEPYANLKKNAPFKMETIGQEQSRITNVVRNAGYFKFSNDDVIFVVDTINKAIFGNILDPFANIQNAIDISGKKEQPHLNITVQILNPTDSTSFQQYTIRNVYVYPDYSTYLTRDDSVFKSETYHDLIIRYRHPIIRPRVLNNNIYIKKGAYYSQENYDYTINRLNSLGLWKFVTIEMDTVQGVKDMLDCYLFLTPGKKQELGANLEATSSSDYIIGGALNLTYRNKNTNRAANQVSATLKTGVEWNSDSARSFFVQPREYSGQVNVSAPRFITPWRIRDVGRLANAHTTLGMGFNYLDRLGFFALNSFNGSFGYDWNETAYKKWIVKPFAVEYNRIYNISSDFAQQLIDNPFLKNSFSSTFIGGENISFIFNTQDPLHMRHFNYFRINFDESGLWLNGIDAAIRGVSSGNSDFAKLTSVNFSQYVKMDVEFKHYFNRKHASFISRIYGGVGIPYGTSDVLPYVKQFTAGGPSSMRGWRLRALGPGSYYNPDYNNPKIFSDQTGDMKIEGNLEYRFDILKLFGGFLMLKGAWFVDAGNIWTLKENPGRPGSAIRLARFYQDIAVGGGFGLRLDFSYAVLRFDLATPFKVPYIPENYGWIFHTIQPLDPTWRKNNIIFNFAVGYPF